jgi:hypothetical protein
MSVSKEELERMKGVSVEKAVINEEPKDYKVIRRLFHDGKMAPKGQIYLCVHMKSNGLKIKASKLILGGQGEDFENRVASIIRLQIKEKYKV